REKGLPLTKSHRTRVSGRDADAHGVAHASARHGQPAPAEPGYSGPPADGDAAQRAARVHPNHAAHDAAAAQVGHDKHAGHAVAFIFSAAVTLGYPGMPLWEELATLVTIMLLGHWIEMRSISQAEGAQQELAKLLPNTAVCIVGDRTQEVPVSELREGDIVLV